MRGTAIGREASRIEAYGDSRAGPNREHVRREPFSDDPDANREHVRREPFSDDTWPQKPRVAPLFFRAPVEICGA